MRNLVDDDDYVNYYTDLLTTNCHICASTIVYLLKKTRVATYRWKGAPYIAGVLNLIEDNQIARIEYYYPGGGHTFALALLNKVYYIFEANQDASSLEVKLIADSNDEKLFSELALRINDKRYAYKISIYEMSTKRHRIENNRDIIDSIFKKVRYHKRFYNYYTYYKEYFKHLEKEIRQ